MLQWRPFLGPFHSVLLHFPIGFLVATCLLVLYRVWRPSPELRRLNVWAIWLTLGSTVVVAILGLWRASAGGYDEATLAVHRNAAFVVLALLAAAALVEQLALRRAHSAGAEILSRFLLVLALAAVAVAGHYGGTLAHGSQFLVRNAPAPLQAWLSGGEEEKNLGDRMFVDTVRPVFEARCYGCHGNGMSAGNYRLDDPAIALAGGSSGRPAIVPGKPLESELVRRLLLLPDDQGAMPPTGGRPTADEVMSVLAWIERGAPMQPAR